MPRDSLRKMIERIPEVKIEIKSIHEALDEFAETLKAVRTGKHVEPKRSLSFESVEAFRSFFTEKRLEMLRVIRHKEPGSVYGLAKMLKRDLKSVRTDLDILVQLGLVRVKKKKAKTRTGYKKVPYVDFDRLILEMLV